MKILPPEDKIKIVPEKSSLRELVARQVLTNAQFTLASDFGMLEATHTVFHNDKPIAFLLEEGEKTSVLPVVTPARFGFNTTQHEFECLLALTR